MGSVTIRFGLSVLIACSVSLGGCDTAPNPRLRSDVERYLAAMQAWAGVEREVGHALERILATQFVDDAEVRRQIADARPRIQNHLVDIESDVATTPDVRALHEAYVIAWKALLDGLLTIDTALTEADTASLARGRASLYRWRRDLRAIANDLRDLARLVGLETRRARVDSSTRALASISRRRPTLPHGDRAVPSALEGLTAVFGMGTGVSPPP